MPANIRWRTVLCALAACTLSTVAAAEGPAQGNVASLADVIKVGDAVSVTRWSGGTLKGEVTAATTCTLRVRDATGIREMSLADIKTVRRHKARKINGASTAMHDFANQCDAIECAPAALASAGIGALVQGIDNLTHPPKVVYRSKTRPDATPACAPVTPSPTGLPSL